MSTVCMRHTERCIFDVRLLRHVQENVVGDTKVPLLQIMPLCGDNGDYVCERYETPIYTPVRRNNILDMKIDITDDMERIVPFQAGKLYCHFI